MGVQDFRFRAERAQRVRVSSDDDKRLVTDLHGLRKGSMMQPKNTQMYYDNEPLGGLPMGCKCRRQ